MVINHNLIKYLLLLKDPYPQEDEDAERYECPEGCGRQFLEEAL